MKYRSLSFALLAAFSFAACSFAAAGENRIKNPGFEDNPPSTGWSDNNWAKWEVETGLDTNNPRSGAYAKKVKIVKVRGEGDFQLAQGIDVKSGESLEIRLWMRGLSNSRPVNVVIRQKPAPYKTYFSSDVLLTSEWQEFVFRVTLPDGIDEGNIGLFIRIQDETTVWVDDVSVTTLPAREDAPPIAGNAIRNGSFEVGRDGWTATFRENGGLSAGIEAEEANADQNIISLEIENPPHGHRALEFKVRHLCSATLTSGFFPLRYGHPVKISFWLKTNVKGLTVFAGLGCGIFPNMVWERKDFTTKSSEWERFEFTATPRPNAAGTYVFEIAARQPGVYLLDDVQVRDQEAPQKDESVAPVAGFENPPGGDPARLFDKDAEAQLLLNIQTLEDIALTVRVEDPWGREVAKFPLAVRGQAKVSQHPITLPTGEYGGFKCSVFAKGSDFPLAEAIYSVLPQLPPLKEAKDSYFGSHVRLNPYNLHIAERAGFRWLRLHPPLTTKWMLVEPEKGVWEFDFRGVKRATEQGFRLLGNFDTTPSFYADADPGKEMESSWHRSWPPADYAAWREYVKRTAKAFQPYIKDWEVWNEPDGGFLQIPKGKDKAAVYREIIHQTRVALDELDIPLNLGAGAVSNLHRPLTRDVLALGAGEDIDFYSFHYYDGCADKSPEEAGVIPEIEHIRTFKDRKGEPLEVWHTEGSATGPSWLDTLRISTSDTIGVGDYATMLVRSAALFKAIGVKRYFHYDSFAHPAGSIVYRRLTDMADADGVPQPSLAAHAAMVYFLEDTEPAGFRRLNGERVRVASFRKKGKAIDVVWARPDAVLGDAPELRFQERRAYDIMGNPITVDAATALTTKPIYLVDP